MLMMMRHLLSILMLPFVMTVLVPRWLLAGRDAADTGWDSGSVTALAAKAGGALLLLAGLALVAWCVSLFARVGKGTLAPWDPTQRLVVVGPYRYTRNPMITGVLTILAGEALVLGSRAIALWALTFFLFNTLYFLLSEEPGLRRRFGKSYVEYTAAVPRWLPRLTPWSGG